MALATEFRSDPLVKKELGLCNFPRTLRRKRVAVSRWLEDSPFSSPTKTPPPPRKRPGKKSCRGSLHLEALPQDILVHILCSVNHNDLKQLFHVSKSVREAALIAEKMHFAFSTPPSKAARLTPVSSDSEDEDESDDALNAPRQLRFRSRLNRANLEGISVALFTSSPEEKQWEES